MEQGLVPHAADRDAAQFLDSHRHGRGIRLGVERVVLVRNGGEPLVAADPGSASRSTNEISPPSDFAPARASTSSCAVTPLSGVRSHGG